MRRGKSRWDESKTEPRSCIPASKDEKTPNNSLRMMNYLSKLIPIILDTKILRDPEKKTNLFEWTCNQLNLFKKLEGIDYQRVMLKRKIITMCDA